MLNEEKIKTLVELLEEGIKDAKEAIEMKGGIIAYCKDTLSKREAPFSCFFGLSPEEIFEETEERARKIILRNEVALNTLREVLEEVGFESLIEEIARLNALRFRMKEVKEWMRQN